MSISGTALDFLDMRLPIFINTCLMCGRPLLDAEQHLCTLCGLSLESPVFGPGEMLRRFGAEKHIAAHHSLFIYSHDEVPAAMIRAGKYNDRPQYFATLGRLLAARLCTSKALTGVDALVPVPMHWVKQMRRGYNQTHIIAREISRLSHIPVVKALKARRSHAKLAGSSARHRAAAVAGLFAPVSPDALAGKNVAIIDDVLTTGSTLTQAARAAISAGAVSVISITLGTAPS